MKKPARAAPAAAAPVARNVRQKLDGLTMLRTLPDTSAWLAFLDPQYREVLDKLGFGNEGERQGRRADLPQMSGPMIAKMVAEIGRVLKGSGHLILWTDKFNVATGKWRHWLDDTIDFTVVDMLAWNSLRFGMGKRLRCTTEYAMILQKVPTKASAWRDHDIRDCWPEQSDREMHPHAKPVQLTKAIIKATTRRGEIVIDPCAGGYGVLDACIETGREFIGCDLR